MRIRTALSCILATLLAVTRAEAAAPYMVDVVRPKALLQFDGMEQSVSFLYSYMGTENSGTSSSSHTFQERYHIGSGFTILDPSVAQLTAAADIGFDQAMASEGSTTNGFTYDYALNALILQYDPYPVSVSSSRTTTQVSTAYLPTYSVTSNSNQIWLRLLNKRVPLTLRYNRTSMDTEGLERDSSSTNNTLSLTATNNFRDRSLTELNLTYNGMQSRVSGGSTESSRNYGLNGSNSLILDSASKYTLASSFAIAESKQADVPKRSGTIAETLTGVLGKTLLGRAVYQHTYNETVGNDKFSRQDQASDTVNLLLTHQLFSSLATNVGAMYQNQRLNDAGEVDYGGTVSLNYQKRLPRKSLLKFDVSGGRTYVDRENTLSQLVVRDEPHRAGQQGDYINLGAPGALESVSTVKSHNPEQLYVEGVDYLVNLPLSRIEIVSGGTIAPGTDLYITYTLLQDPSVEYYSDIATVSSSVSLFENRYVISGDYTTTKQHITSGRADTISLFDSSTLHLRLDANYLQNFLAAEYASVDSGQTKYSSLSGSWRYVKSFSKSDISLNMLDRYTSFDGTGAQSSTWENLFNVGGTLSRGVYGWGKLSLSSTYGNTTGDNGTSNFAFFRGNLLGRINQLQFTLTGQTSLRLNRGKTSRNDSINLSIIRNF